MGAIAVFSMLIIQFETPGLRRYRAFSDKPKGNRAIWGNFSVPAGIADHVAIADMIDNFSIPDAGDLVSKLKLKGPAIDRAIALIRNRYLALKPTSPIIDDRKIDPIISWPWVS